MTGVTVGAAGIGASAVASQPVTAQAPAQAPAQAQAAGGEVVGLSPVTGNASAAAKFWTQERMSRAKPFDAGSAGRAVGRGSVSTKSRTAGGTAPLTARDYEEKGRTTQVAGTAPTVKMGRRTAVVPEGSATATRPAYAYPSNRIGRVFFEPKPGYVGYCSAAAVTSNTKTVIVTAAHCVYDFANKRAYRKWAYVPGYYFYNGKHYKPFGTWYPKKFWLTNSWKTQRHYGYDFSYVNMFKKEINGKWLGVGGVTGTMGIKWWRGWGLYERAIGYPAESAYGDNGCCQKSVFGYAKKFQVRASDTGDKIYNHLGISGSGKFLSGGASGGPWLLSYNTSTRWGYVNGVNSLSNRKNFISTPYWGTTNNTMWKTASTYY